MSERKLVELGEEQIEQVCELIRHPPSAPYRRSASALEAAYDAGITVEEALSLLPSGERRSIYTADALATARDKLKIFTERNPDADH